MLDVPVNYQLLLGNVQPRKGNLYFYFKQQVFIHCFSLQKARGTSWGLGALQFTGSAKNFLCMKGYTVTSGAGLVQPPTTMVPATLVLTMHMTPLLPTIC